MGPRIERGPLQKKASTLHDTTAGGMSDDEIEALPLRAGSIEDEMEVEHREFKRTGTVVRNVRYEAAKLDAFDADHRSRRARFEGRHDAARQHDRVLATAVAKMRAARGQASPELIAPPRGPRDDPLK